MAIFPLENYTGTLTQDLFAEEDTTYFDDAEQFMRLQEEAVEALAAAHRQTAAWVEITHDNRLHAWQYPEAEDGAPGGTIINLSPSGHVETLSGVTRPAPDLDVLPESRPRGPAPAHLTGPSGSLLDWNGL